MTRVLAIILLFDAVAMGSGIFERANSDYLLVADHASEDLSYATGFTVCGWAKFNATGGSGNNCIFQITDSGATTFATILMYQGATPALVMYAPSTMNTHATTSVTTEWMHFAIVGNQVDTTEYATYYINGAGVGKSNTSGSALSAAYFYIGRNKVGNVYMDGQIAEVAVYQSALAPAQITSLQTSEPCDVGSPAVYLPLYDDGAEDIISLAVTNNGVTFSTADHPIDYPEETPRKKVLWLTKPIPGNTWYVRPVTGEYGAEDGTSYATAWDGLENVTWGTGGVEAGDTLYVCGLHLRSGASVYDEITPDANGTDDSHRIVIRGDFMGDPGVIWGAGILAHEAWTDQGGGVYSITIPMNLYDTWFFEDITASSWTVLQSADTLVGCQGTAGSFYAAAFTKDNTLYVHTSDGLSPTGRIAANRLGYYLHLVGNKYITFQDLSVYCNYRWVTTTATEPQGISYIRWDGCTLQYGEQGIFNCKSYHHDLQWIDCDIGYAANGLYLCEYPLDGLGNGPSNILVHGCKIHDMGLGVQANSDAHGIGCQGLNDSIIEQNEIYNTGSGVTFYENEGQTSMNHVIARWNYIHDTHTEGGANSRGIEFNCDNDCATDRADNSCYGNIVAHVDDVGYRYVWSQYELPFYNNLAYDCGTSFYIANNKAIGPHVRLKNNISLSPTTRHLYFLGGVAATDFLCDSDYNLFYPVSGDDFYLYLPGALLTGCTYGEWKAASATGCVFDPTSLSNDPLITDAGNGDFTLQPGSPCINAGLDLGDTWDDDLNPAAVWPDSVITSDQDSYGAGWEIGAYIYVE